MGTTRPAGIRRTEGCVPGRSSRQGRTAPARTNRRTDSPVRSWIRRTFVSTGSTSRPKAKLPTAAAVYGPTPGSSVRSSGQPSLGDDPCGAMQADRPPVVTEPLPGDDHVGRRGGCERLGGRPALEPGEPRGITRSTCVCCSITSLTRIAYGSRVGAMGAPGHARGTRREGAYASCDSRLGPAETRSLDRVRCFWLQDEHDELPWAVNALDAAQLDVRGRRRAGDQRDRPTLGSDQFSGTPKPLGYELDDLRSVDDADMEIGDQRQRAAAARLGVGGEDDRARLGDCSGAACDGAIERVEAGGVECRVRQQLKAGRSPFFPELCRDSQTPRTASCRDVFDRRRYRFRDDAENLGPVVGDALAEEVDQASRAAPA